MRRPTRWPPGSSGWGNGRAGKGRGGALSLIPSVAAPVDATIVYYGNVGQSADKLAKLEGPLQGHFAERDGWINHAVVYPFPANLKKLGKKADLYWYDADHAFANPTGQNFVKKDAALAWSRTLGFLKANL